MMCDKYKDLPQVDNLEEGNSTADSDRVRAPVVGAGCKDSGGSQPHIIGRLRHLAQTTISDKKTGEENPFRKSSILTRTPPDNLTTPTGHGDEINLDGESDSEVMFKVQDHITETVLTSSEVEVGRLEEQIKEAEDTEEKQLSAIKETLGMMALAAGKQKNVNMAIKNGIIQIENGLEILNACRLVRRNAIKGLMERSPITVINSPKEVRVLPPRKRPRVSTTSPETSNTPCNAQNTEAQPEANKWTSVERRGKKTRSNTSMPVEKTSYDKRTATNSARKREARPRRKVLIIKPASGKSYAEVLGAIRKDVHPEDTGTEIHSVRKTLEGRLLLELGDCQDQGALQAAIKTAIGEGGEVQCLTPRMKLEILDLDSCTTEEEVKEAVSRDLGENLSGEAKVSLVGPNLREQCMAIVELEEVPGLKLLEKARLKVGWVSARIRRRVEVQRCYRCLEYGHRKRECKGQDRSGLCWKCGHRDHKAAQCQEEPRCILCADRGTAEEFLHHAPGTGRCKVFREALERKKSTRKMI